MKISQFAVKISALFYFFSIASYSQMFLQKKKTTAFNRVVQHRYGISSGIDGNRAIVGAYWDNVDQNGNNPYSAAGSAYLLERIGGVWQQVQKIVPSDRGTDPSGQAIFGEAVSIYDTIAVIGASGEDYDTIAQNQIINGGAVYIFTRNSLGQWVQRQKIIASDRGVTDNFGSAVSISGNYLIVGANKDDEDASGANAKSDAGSAYIFEKNTNGKWIQKSKIVPSDRAASDFFGWTVSISEEGYAIIGAYGQDLDSNGLNSLSGAGAAYIFKRDVSGNWIQTQKLISKDRESSGRFGMSVDITKDKCIVGADLENEGIRTFCGSAYVYERVSGNYKFVQKITASDMQDSDGLGRSVSIDGDYAIAGANLHDHAPSGLVSNAGVLYLYKKQSNGTWSEQEHIATNDRGASDLFGLNAHLSGNKIIAGVYFEDEDTSGANTLSEAGSAYIFEMCIPTSYTLTASTCNSYTSPSGIYTWSVSGTYNDTLINADGCDSLITINLSVNSPSSATITIAVCDSLLSPSGNFIWINSGNYNDTIPNSFGCDSLLTINLTINNSYSNINIVSCDSSVSPSGNHIWYSSGNYNDTISNHLGCDSIIVVNLTINNSTYDTISPSVCNSYLSPSGVYSWNTSGVYYDTISTFLGCDSVLRINLTVTVIDTGVTNSNNILSSNQVGAVYQWLDCGNSNSPIGGATAINYTVSANGSYAVSVTYNGCTDTSACVNILNVSTAEAYPMLEKIVVFPNPFDDKLIITNLPYDKCEVSVVNTIGEVVVNTFTTVNNVEIKLDGLGKGIYFLLIETEELRGYYKILKE